MTTTLAPELKPDHPKTTGGQPLSALRPIRLPKSQTLVP